jgi:DNA-binding CsgD family transcriptional regulator
MNTSSTAEKQDIEKLKVLILCANPLLSMGLSRAIAEWEEFSLLDPTTTEFEIGHPRIVIADEHKSIPNSAPLLERCLQPDGPRIGMLIEKLAASATPPFPVAAYIHVGIEPLRLKVALLTMAYGDYWIDGALRANMPSSTNVVDIVVGTDHTGTGLTAREYDVLKLVATGLTNTDIGTALFISVPTVKAHLRSILSKLKAADRTHAAVVAVQKGWFAVNEPSQG